MCGKGRQYEKRALNHEGITHRRAQVLEVQEHTSVAGAWAWAQERGVVGSWLDQVVEGEDQGKDTAVQEDAVPHVHFAKK